MSLEKWQNAPTYEEFLLVATSSTMYVEAEIKLRNPGGNPRFRGNPESPPRFQKDYSAQSIQFIHSFALHAAI